MSQNWQCSFFVTNKFKSKCRFATTAIFLFYVVRKVKVRKVKVRKVTVRKVKLRKVRVTPTTSGLSQISAEFNACAEL
jgi:hypothetical protein